MRLDRLFVPLFLKRTDQFLINYLREMQSCNLSEKHCKKSSLYFCRAVVSNKLSNPRNADREGGGKKYIKYETPFFTTFLNIEKRVHNTTGSGVFVTSFEVLGNVVKHS